LKPFATLFAAWKASACNRGQYSYSLLMPWLPTYRLVCNSPLNRRSNIQHERINALTRREPDIGFPVRKGVGSVVADLFISSVSCILHTISAGRWAHNNMRKHRLGYSLLRAQRQGQQDKKRLEHCPDEVREESDSKQPFCDSAPGVVAREGTAPSWVQTPFSLYVGRWLS